MTASPNHPYSPDGAEVPPPGTVPHQMVTTAFELDGYQIVRSLGVVRGITVRSRSVVGNLGAALQTLVGGNITILTSLCERTRNESFNLMIEHAAQLGANAVIGALRRHRGDAGRYRGARLRHGGRSGAVPPAGLTQRRKPPGLGRQHLPKMRRKKAAGRPAPFSGER